MRVSVVLRIIGTCDTTRSIHVTVSLCHEQKLIFRLVGHVGSLVCSGFPAKLDSRCTFDVVCAPNESFVQKQGTQIYLHVEFLHIEVPNPLIRNFNHACLGFAVALRIVRAGETVILQLTFPRRDLPEWVQRWSSCASNSDIVARATSDIAFLQSSVKLLLLQHLQLSPKFCIFALKLVKMLFHVCKFCLTATLGRQDADRKKTLANRGCGSVKWCFGVLLCSVVPNAQNCC